MPKTIRDLDTPPNTLTGAEFIPVWQGDVNGDTYHISIDALGLKLGAFSSGNFSGSLNSAGDFTVATNKFTVTAATGAVAFVGGLTVNGTKFTVNAANGNVVTQGTMAVTGTSTFTGVATFSNIPAVRGAPGSDGWSILMSDTNHMNNYSVTGFVAGVQYVAHVADTTFGGNSNYGKGGATLWDWHPTSTATAGAFCRTGNGNGANPGRWLMRMDVEFTPEMWGAIGDGTTDDKDALQSAVNAIINSSSSSAGSPTQTNGGTLRLTPGKKYLIAGGTVMAGATKWQAGATYAVGAKVYNPITYHVALTNLDIYNGGAVYTCTAISTGVSGSTGPTGTANGQVDGGVTWNYSGTGDLVLYSNINVEGRVTNNQIPTMPSGAWAPISGLYLDPKVTIQVMQNAMIRRTSLIASTLQVATRPTADQVIAAVAAWGTSKSIGVWLAGGNASCQELMILGFNQGIRMQSAPKALRDIYMDCYNGIDSSRIGDTGIIHNVQMIPWYSPSTGWLDVGSGSVPNGWRPGIAFNIRDRSDGIEYSKCYAFNYGIAFRVAGTYLLQLIGPEVDFDPALKAAGCVGLGIVIENHNSYVNIISPKLGGSTQYCLVCSNLDYNDPGWPNGVDPSLNGGGAAPGAAGVQVNGGYVGANMQINAGSRFVIRDSHVNMSGSAGGIQVSDDVRFAGFYDLFLTQGDGTAWLAASTALLRSGKVQIDNIRHADNTYNSNFVRLLQNRTTLSADPTVVSASTDALQPPGVLNVNSTQPLTGSGTKSKDMVFMRNWTEIGSLSVSNEGVSLDLNSTVLTVRSVAKVSGGSGYKAGNIVPIAGGTLATPGGSPAKIKVISVTGSAINLFELYEGGSYSVLPSGTASVSGIVSGVTAGAGGSAYVQNTTVSNVSGDGTGAKFSPVITAGAVTSYVPIDNGSGYTTATVAVLPSVSGTAAAGATATATIGSGATFTVAGSAPDALDLNASGGPTTVGGPLTVSGPVSAPSFKIGSDPFLSSPAATSGGYNTLGGRSAGLNLSTSAIETTVFGYGAGGSGFRGSGSGGTGMTGAENSFFGWYSGTMMTTGAFNSAFGVNTMGAEYNGNNLSAFGTDAMRNSVGLVSCLAFGTNALRNGTGTLTSIAIGNSAMVGDETSPSTSVGNDIVAIGHFAVSSATRTTLNNTVAIGTRAGSSLQTGGAAILIGTDTGKLQTVGNNIVGMGFSVLSAATGVSDTVAIGRGAGGGAITSANNSFYGHLAGAGTTGSSNSAFGSHALEAVGGAVNSVAFGHNAGKLYTGNGGVFIGPQVGSTTAATGNNIILIGTSSACDTPASGTTNYLRIAGGATAIIEATTTNATPSITLGGPTKLLGPLSLPLPVDTTTDYTLGVSDSIVIYSASAAKNLTLPAASSFPGRTLTVSTTTAFAVNSPTSNVTPKNSTTPGTVIVPAVAGAGVDLVSDGTNWRVFRAWQ